MKILKFIYLSFLGIALLSACAKHDFFDETSITGNIGPHAYWEIGSAAISAGSEMPFEVQYYTTVENTEIDRSEVWYNIFETEYKSVSCPWVISRTYSITSSISEEKRVSQKIQEYPHALAAWDTLRHAYSFNATFPISNTLNVFTWKPDVFEYDKMETYFGAGFMENFKDSLSTIMTYADYKNMLIGLDIVDDFKQYTDSTLDLNQGDDVYVYHFPNHTVPAEVTELYDNVPFDRLIEKASVYYVGYERSYYINAILRVYDKRGVYGTTISKEIYIN